MKKSSCRRRLLYFFFIFASLLSSMLQRHVAILSNLTSLSSITLRLQEHGRELVDGIDFYITEEYGTQLFDSCKDVKFAAMNTRAMDFIGAGAKNYTGNNVDLSLYSMGLHLI